MTNWKQLAVMIPVLAGVLIGIGYFQSMRDAPKPNDYVTHAMKSTAVGKTSNSKLLLDACGRVDYQPVAERDGGYVVEARGTLKENGNEIIVRWLVFIVRDGNTTAKIANLQYASIDGVELKPPESWITRLGGEVSKK